MFSRLFQRSAPPSAPVPPQVPAGSRIYAIGDVHGRADLLERLRTAIVEDAKWHPVPRKVVVYLGDYVDRGPDSRGVVDLLVREALPGFESVFLKGNHEDSLLQFLTDPGITPAWMAYGGEATLYSYGVRPPDSRKVQDVLGAQKAFIHALPSAHLEFLAALKLVHIEGDYAFVHAGFREGVPIEFQDPQDMMWIRNEFLFSDADFGKVAVHGHTITDRPEIRPNRIGIDTGAFATGTLTCLVLEGTERRFLAT
jgi:serine/threonine protein phosphatase 1